MADWPGETVSIHGSEFNFEQELNGTFNLIDVTPDSDTFSITDRLIERLFIGCNGRE